MHAVLETKWHRNFIRSINYVFMEQEIIAEMSKLLEKTGLENVVPLKPTSGENKKQVRESTLMNLKSLNARYEKAEAINQVQWLMSTYNIQIDELMERIGS
jgi:hypothetical protein